MKKTCEICNGSGQLSSFKGVSRFLLSWEECPQCSGLGYVIDQDAGSKTKAGELDHVDNTTSGKTPTKRRKGSN